MVALVGKLLHSSLAKTKLYLIMGKLSSFHDGFLRRA